MNGREPTIKPKSRLTIYSEDFQDLGEIKVGDRISARVELKLKSMSEEELETNKNTNRYEFEVSNATVDEGLRKISDFGEALGNRLVK